MAGSYLNEESLKNLIRQITTGIDPQCEGDLEALEDAVTSCHAYVETVVRGETRLLLYGQGVEGEHYRELVSQYDQSRHSCHEAAIISAKVLNRLAALYDLDPVYTGDPGQRHQVADFCLQLDQYFFRNRRMKLS